ncbi:hypothetical protein BBJ28_00022903 [Nothophytophthora sp. Chile5]|nr:hypothetical protein BBJ28_00022903 [Nothophytophthora sp. Chile5]
MKVLNVAEKPSVAKEIAAILSSGRSTRRAGLSKYNALFEFPYEVQGQAVRMVVTSVTGHLMELDFDASWLVLWLDCDREGENIAFEVKSVCERSNRRLRVFRARFSALIPRDIIHAVQNLSVPNEKLSLACDARSEIDLRIGAAFTRFQTMRIQSKFPELKEKGVISYGPCQFPTLGFVVERFLKIQNFEREAFCYISVTHRQDDQPDAPTTTFKWKRDRLFDRMACLCIYECLVESETATIDAVDKRASWKRKPLPLTTVELQKRASRWLRISSEATMKAAESLYNKGFISYPRTETSKFKEGTDLMGLVRLHESHHQWGNYVTQQLLDGGKYEAPRQGNSDDQAHPPIHPTKSVAVNSLSDANEKKVYEFVALHFLACCSRDAKGSQTSIQMSMLEERFSASGLMVEERNYLDIYKFEKWNASAIPVYQRGDVFRPSSVVMLSGETTPPPLLSEADLIAKMDTNGIGTDATIADHIKTILKREYAVKVNNDTQFKPTTLGLALVLSYEQMGLELAKPVLRAAREVNREGPNKGRLFFVCSLPQSDQCSFFAWASDGNAEGGGPVVKCAGHDEPCVERTVKKEGPNKGRLFYSCRRPQTDTNCGFFQWKDEMAGSSSATAAASRGSNASANVLRCPGHEAPCALRKTRKAGPNLNREFYTCSFQGSESCGFFEWKDEVQPQPQPQRQAVASAASSSSALEGAAGEMPTCECGQPAVLLTCRNGDNQGRTFYKCAKPQGSQCKFFLWAS